jgi:capsular polysaccharide biosynthesis protein
MELSKNWTLQKACKRIHIPSILYYYEILSKISKTKIFVAMHGTLMERFVRNAYEFLKFALPYQLKYRPSGVSKLPDLTSVSNNQELRYYPVYRDYLTKLKVSKAFFNKLSKFAIHDHFEEVSEDMVEMAYKRDYGVLSLTNGRIYSNNINFISVITESNRLVSEVSYQYIYNKVAVGQDNQIFRQKFFNKPRFINGTVFSLLATFGATHNLAHWIFDALPRIHLLKESGLFNEIDYFVVPAFTLDYQKDSLKMLGIEKECIIEGGQNTHIIAKNLIVSDHPRGNRSYLLPKWVTDFYRESYLSQISLNTEFPKRLYISRKDSKLRQVINEDEVIDLLDKYGFTSVKMSNYVFIEKARLFNNADIIIGASGAGLASLVFAKKGVKVLELFPQGFVDIDSYNVSSHLNADYIPVVCQSKKPARNGIEAQLEDLYIDIDILNEVVRNKLLH